MVLALRIVLISPWLSTRRFMNMLVKAEAHFEPSVRATISALKTNL